MGTKIPKAKSKFTLGTDKATLEKQLAHTQRGLERHAGGKMYTRRLGKIQDAMGKLPAEQTPEQVAAEEAAAKEKAAADSKANLERYTSTFKEQFAPTLGQTFQDWMGQQGGQFDYAQGRVQEMLNRRLSAQGLLGSGREVEMGNQATNELVGAFADRYQNAHQADIDNAMGWINNQQNATQAEKDSLRNFAQGLIGTAAQQSPLSSAYGASTNAAGATTTLGNQMASGTMASASGGGGGGTPPTMNNNASTDLGIQQILLGNKNQGGLITGVLGSLFGNSGGGSLF